MSDYLPNEVLIDILVRLPVKSLLRFRCVSRIWNSLISSPAFINTHLNQALLQQTNQEMLLFRYYYSIDYVMEDDHGIHMTVNDRREERFSLHIDDESFPHNPYLKLDFPYRCGGYYKHYFQIVASVNGIVCLADPNRCILWNPSVNRVMELPFAFQYPDRSVMHHLGFGCDRVTNDYKLVRLVYFGRKDHYVVPPVVEIFTLSTNSWRQLAAPGPMYVTVQHSSSSQSFASGAFHWVANAPPEEGAFCNLILAFDMANEVFHELPLPSCLAAKSNLNMTLAVLNGLLSLVPRNNGPVDDESYSDSVWIMKEYGMAESWTKLFSIDIQGGAIRRVLSFTKNGEVILLNNSNELVSYESNTQQTRDLEYSVGKRFSKKVYSLDTYMESLVLLNVADVL
ncbi:F-box/kelch-repeat protein At3g06240-like [Rosa rugosa]|uniref:F-box/kelch-repeat protein At3g06240-like n=1 Tax=Rosa rugosa TaxID=74645 RepID=UPI002B413370|nr:F-box/kelch-repeat protein At3g06240-like [Rosa rugosa]